MNQTQTSLLVSSHHLSALLCSSIDLSLSYLLYITVDSISNDTKFSLLFILPIVRMYIIIYCQTARVTNELTDRGVRKATVGYLINKVQFYQDGVYFSPFSL